MPTVPAYSKDRTKSETNAGPRKRRWHVATPRPLRAANSQRNHRERDATARRRPRGAARPTNTRLLQRSSLGVWPSARAQTARKPQREENARSATSPIRVSPSRLGRSQKAKPASRQASATRPKQPERRRRRATAAARSQMGRARPTAGPWSNCTARHQERTTAQREKRIVAAGENGDDGLFFFFFEHQRVVGRRRPC